VRVQGGTSGLIAALMFGRVDPYSGEDTDHGPRWRSKRRDWYAAARAERKFAHHFARAERREMGRYAIANPTLLDDHPF
jgi:hypothetical protein